MPHEMERADLVWLRVRRNPHRPAAALRSPAYGPPRLPSHSFPGQKAAISRGDFWLPLTRHWNLDESKRERPRDVDTRRLPGDATSDPSSAGDEVTMGSPVCGDDWIRRPSARYAQLRWRVSSGCSDAQPRQRHRAAPRRKVPRTSRLYWVESQKRRIAADPAHALIHRRRECACSARINGLDIDWTRRRRRAGVTHGHTLLPSTATTARTRATSPCLVPTRCARGSRCACSVGGGGASRTPAPSYSKKPLNPFCRTHRCRQGSYPRSSFPSTSTRFTRRRCSRRSRPSPSARRAAGGGRRQIGRRAFQAPCDAPPSRSAGRPGTWTRSRL